MAGKGSVSLDTVMINIESNAGKSTANIDKLSSSLANLKTSLKGGFGNLKTLSTYLDNLNKSSNSLGSTVNNLSKISEITDSLQKLNAIEKPKGLASTVTQLNNLAKTSSSLSAVADNVSVVGELVSSLSLLGTIKAPSGLTTTVNDLIKLGNISGLDNTISEMQKVPQMVEPLSKLGEIPSPKGLGSLATNLEKLPNILNKIDTKTLENMTRVSNELATALTPLADKMGQVANGYSAFSKIQNTFGKSASTVTRYSKQHISIFSMLYNVVKRLGSGFLSLSKAVLTAFGPKSMSNLKKFHSKFKQIFLSLLGTRTIFTMIRKAASEYQAFDVTLQKFSQNVWRAFGAQLAPIIEYVMNLFKQFVRVIYSVVLALTGIDLIARANEKAMAEWGKSAKSTLGNLQKFDDLNVVEFDKGKGDEFEPIEMDTIDLTPIQKVIDWVNRLKEAIKAALDTGEWYNVGKVFADGINEGVNFLLSKLPEIKNKLFEIAEDFGDFLNGVIQNVDWSNIGVLITEALQVIPDTVSKFLSTIDWETLGKKASDLLTNINFADIVNSIMNAIGTLAVGLSTAFLEIDFGKVAQNLGDAVIAFFTNIDKILEKIPFKKIGQKVREAIERVDWKGVWDSIVKAAEESFKSINDFLSGLTGLDSSVIEAIEKAIVGIGVAFVTYKIVSNIGKFAGFIDTIGNSNVSMVLIALAGVVKIIADIANILKDPKSTENIKTLVQDLIVFAGVIGGIILITRLMKQFKDATGKASESTKNMGKGKLDLTGFFGDVGTAAKMIAILGGIALVLKELAEVFKTFSETGMSAEAGVTLIVGLFGGLAGAAYALSKSFEGMDWSSIAAGLVMLLGITAVFESLTHLLESVANMGEVTDGALAALGIVMLGVIGLLATMALSAQALQNPMAMAGVAVLVAGISAILLVMAATLPTILDAVGKFIKDVGPTLIQILEVIGNTIIGIIFSLGTVLPPIINSVGGLFNTVFKGVQGIIKTVGDTIVKILKTTDSTIGNVLGHILNFINELGPAVERFVNSMINAVTKLINFVVSGMEYLINTAIINPINSLISAINDNAIAEKLGWQLGKLSKVQIDRFVPALATGTNEIPYEGIYHLHPGEAVVPKKYNPALGNGGGEEMNEKLDTLIGIMSDMNFTNVVNIGNKKVYEGQQAYNKRQQNKYGTINLY